MPAKKSTSESSKPRARSKKTEPEAAQPLLKDRRFIGALVFLTAVAVFAAGYFIGHAAGEEGDTAAQREPGVVVTDREPGGAGFIGVVGTDARRGPGAVILEVFPDSPAARAGLERGDRVVGAAGHDIVSMRALARLVRATEPGRVIELEVVRGDERFVAEVEVGETPPQRGFGRLEPQRNRPEG